jgi:putative ABC transport system permease protein
MPTMILLRLAIKILRHDHAKALACLGGVAVAVCLVLVQQGIHHGSILCTSQVIEHSRADLWVFPVGVLNFDATLPLPDTTAYLVRSVPGVERVEPLVVNFADWRLPDGATDGVQMIGYDLQGELFRPWNVREGDLGELNADRTVFIDRGDCRKLAAGIGSVTEIRRSRASSMGARVVGMTEGIQFLHSRPVVFTGIRNARAYCGLQERQASYLLVRTSPGWDPMAVRRAIESRVPLVECQTRAQFGARTREHWDRYTGIGVILFVTTAMSVIGGVVAVGMLQYLSTLENLREYAMLKALGSPNRRVVGLIAAQGMLMGLGGYVAGVALSYVVQHSLDFRLGIVVTAGMLQGVFAGAIVFCVGSALLCAVRVLWTDPGLVFKA